MKRLTLSTILALMALMAQGQSDIPLVYDVENTGAQLTKPVMPEPDQLPVIRELPDALEGVTSFADWQKRRSDIAHMIQHYGIGEKPAVEPSQVKARMEGDTALVVDVTVNGQTLTLRAVITYPKAGQPPYALMIGTSMISLPKQLFENRPIALMTFHESQVNDYSQWRPHHDRGEHNFDRLYPNLVSNGAYSEWAWGLSRLIDGLQQLGSEVTKIENIDKTDYHWFLESQREHFKGDSVYQLPYDQHELCAMVCPRALLLLGNPDYPWLADDAMLPSAEAAKKVWERFGIGDRMDWSIIGGHGHCQLPEVQFPIVERFIDRFLLEK